MNICYCNEKCSKGIKICEELLDKNNSAYDAALDFFAFAKECFKTCPFKDVHREDDV